MKPTMEILARIKRNSTDNKEEKFSRLYRYLLRPDVYFEAYKHLYANKGAATNGKKRPLGLPTFTDKLVQEALRMLLESVYEPVFLDCSHGFRPRKSCHTALEGITKGFNGIRWFVEGDIKGCFDNIDHGVLVGLINQKVKDARIVKLIYKFLKAGYMEDWQYYKTYSGTPQGGIISPLLANIYLHELDKFVMKLKAEFDKPPERLYTPEYSRVQNRVRKLKVRIDKASPEKRQGLIEKYKQTRAELLRTPSKSQTDKKIKYVRYADDFLIGVNGSREDCAEIKRRLSEFIGQTLKMELSESKTLITHSNTHARFLGYNVRVRRNSQIKRGSTTNCTKRTLNGMVELSIPFVDKINKFVIRKSVAEQQKDSTLRAVCRPYLLHMTDLEIVTTFNAELRGICNYYNKASNFYNISYFAYLMEYSCLKTLAAKHRSSISKIVKKFKDGKGKWGIPYKTKEGWKCRYFADYTDCKKAENPTDKKTNAEVTYRYSVTTFESRLKAKTCELCGATESDYYEIHHVRKVKDLKGKEPWERAMIAKRRKTLVVCRNCHHEIHNQ